MRRLLTGLLLVATALASAFTLTPASSAEPAPGSCDTPHWVAAWGAPPTDAVAGQAPLEQTFRIQVVPSTSGAAVRVHLSNRFGALPVLIGAATIGRQVEGAAVDPASLRTVTFGGATKVRMSAHQDVVSDPVPLAVTGGETLLASLYVVGVNLPATQHVLAEQTTWQSPPLSGDRTRATSAAGFVGLPAPGVTPAIPQAIPYLTGLDVETTGAAGSVVAFGDSITDGFQGTLLPVLPAAAPVDRQARYPDALARRLRGAGMPLAAVNAGISGNQLLRDAYVPVFGPAGLGRFADDGLDRAGVTTVVLLEGINDIGQSSASPEALVAGYQQAIAQAHARGIRILLGTLTPDEGTLQPGYGSAGEAARQAVNAWIRTQTASDGVVDFDAAVRDPAHPTRILPAYDGGDHLHLNADGYRAMADAVPLDALASASC